ncbi:hypothetical protein [Micromonospora sp. U56]|uniref:hypothetical protein n=1 Tax=Micromonospora sp. U56 TaxID=2824900 RepID=UPI001B38107E|nr:hypothetical protein [Micromonospora sp. U56]
MDRPAVGGEGLGELGQQLTRSACPSINLRHLYGQINLPGPAVVGIEPKGQFVSQIDRPGDLQQVLRPDGVVPVHLGDLLQPLVCLREEAPIDWVSARLD